MLLQNYPNLRSDEFGGICRAAAHKYGGFVKFCETSNDIWLEIESCFEATVHEPAAAGQDIEEFDTEALARPLVSGFVTYSVCLSPIYGVPILYFQSPWLQSVEHVYKHLVPTAFKSQIREFGVMGAISYQEHPVNARPAFFIHPCNTATALVELRQGSAVHDVEYLELWLGIVGQCVGLHLPSVPTNSSIE